MLQDLKEATEGDFRSPLLLYCRQGVGGALYVAKLSLLRMLRNWPQSEITVHITITIACFVVRG